MRKIKSLPKDLRPREKLLKYGASVLSFEELLSVIFVTGNRNLEVHKIAYKVGKILRNEKFEDKEFAKLGIGETKFAQVLALIEIGKRLNEKSKTVNAISASQIYGFCRDIINGEKESLICFYINGRGEILKREIVAVGSMNNTLVLPREIFSLIKELPVASIILVHNHPSGELEASEMDVKFTKRVKMAGEILGVTLLDHLIISSKGWKRVKN